MVRSEIQKIPSSPEVPAPAELTELTELTAFLPPWSRRLSFLLDFKLCSPCFVQDPSEGLVFFWECPFGLQSNSCLELDCSYGDHADSSWSRAVPAETVPLELTSWLYTIATKKLDPRDQNAVGESFLLGLWPLYILITVVSPHAHL